MSSQIVISNADFYKKVKYFPPFKKKSQNYLQLSDFFSNFAGKFDCWHASLSVQCLLTHGESTHHRLP